MNSDEELRVVRTRKGASRPASKASPGYDRDILSNEDGKLLGPTESRPATSDDIPESNTFTQPGLAQQVLGELVKISLEAFRPHISNGVDYMVDHRLGIPKAWKWASGKTKKRRSKNLINTSTANAVVEQITSPEISDTDVVSETNKQDKHRLTAEQYDALLTHAQESEKRAADVKRLLANSVVVPDEEAIPGQTSSQDFNSPVGRTTPRSALEQSGSNISDNIRFIDFNNQTPREEKSGS